MTDKQIEQIAREEWWEWHSDWEAAGNPIDYTDNEELELCWNYFHKGFEAALNKYKLIDLHEIRREATSTIPENTGTEEQ